MEGESECEIKRRNCTLLDATGTISRYQRISGDVPRCTITTRLLLKPFNIQCKAVNAQINFITFTRLLPMRLWCAVHMNLFVRSAAENAWKRVKSTKDSSRRDARDERIHCLRSVVPRLQLRRVYSFNPHSCSPRIRLRRAFFCLGNLSTRINAELLVAHKNSERSRFKIPAREYGSVSMMQHYNLYDNKETLPGP